VDTLREPQVPADAPTGQHQLNQFVKLIRKLRWIGMENEGNCVHMHHELRRIPPCDVVLATPRETD